MMTTKQIAKTAWTPSKRLRQLAKRIDRSLSASLPKASSRLGVVHEAMRYCVFSGGKRYRPLLTLGACEAVGGAISKAMPAACAIELIHTYSLVHDDLPAMDDADERRGKPSCHRKFGEGNAILVGDALLTLAFHWVGQNGNANALKILRVIGEASGTQGLIGGQVLDLEAMKNDRISAESLIAIAQRKTAALIRAAVLAGGLAGGASAADQKRLRAYGEDVGLAFQLVDDVHDNEGLARAMGTEGARAKADALIQRAVKSLKPFGKRADILRQMVDWLARS